MNIDVKIERIDNGYIVISNDSSGSKVFFSSLEEFAVARIVEPLRHICADIPRCEKPDKPFMFKLSSDL